MTVKSNVFTRIPKTPAGKEVFSFFMPARYKRLIEERTHNILKDYSSKVLDWNSVEGAKLDKPGYYEKTPFSADKQLYTYLRLWHTLGGSKGKVAPGEFAAYVEEAKGNDAEFPLSAPTTLSRPLRLLLRCAWNIASERSSGKATSEIRQDVTGIQAVFSYVGLSPYSDSMLDRFRPSAMKLIEEFAEFLGGHASVKTTGFAHEITIEMPMAMEKKN
ncbi:MAG: hypothetical protein WCT52_00745 [Candidatus Micrarchaeia archaeon]